MKARGLASYLRVVPVVAVARLFILVCVICVCVIFISSNIYCVTQMKKLCPVGVLRVWVSEGLTQADS